MLFWLLGQWNLTPLLTAEEGHLLETEVPLPAFEDLHVSSVGSTSDVLESGLAENANPSSELKASSTKDVLSDPNSNECTDKSGQCEPEYYLSQPAVDIGSIYDAPNPLVHCGRYLAFHFLLTEQKDALKSDKLVRVTVKNLALNCLMHVGTMVPEIWNATLSKSAGIYSKLFSHPPLVVIHSFVFIQPWMFQSAACSVTAAIKILS